MRPQELNKSEMMNINGGLLGILGDDNMLKGVLQGGINIHDTNRDGETRSTGIDFGLGTLLESMND